MPHFHHFSIKILQQCIKSLKKAILTSIWSAQHPNAGRRKVCILHGGWLAGDRFRGLSRCMGGDKLTCRWNPYILTDLELEHYSRAQALNYLISRPKSCTRCNRSRLPAIFCYSHFSFILLVRKIPQLRSLNL